MRRSQNLQRLWLIGASLLFYGWLHWWFVPILLATSLLDFYLASTVSKKPSSTRAIILVSVASNVGLLIWFKFGGALQGNDSWIIPLGISFYTLQSLSYVIDVAKGIIPPLSDYRQFLVLVCMFPHLSAGPIVRVKDMLPQMERIKAITMPVLWASLPIIVQGYFKKCVLADNLSPTVQALLADPNPSGANARFGMVCFAFQIFFDFSGYSEMAIGLARLLGYDLLKNFEDPYLSTSITEFWRRWHISLSTWIRDYVYIPLGGSRCSPSRTALNTILSLALSGIWHGSHLTCLIYGLWHGVLICLERLLPGVAKQRDLPWVRPFSTLLTFGLVVIGWIWLLCPNVNTALGITKALFATSGAMTLPITFRVQIILVLISLFGIFAYARNLKWIGQGVGSPLPIMIRTGVLAGLAIAFSAPPTQFFYFHF